ncbi:unnamed protein product [Leuciscus chuanchicus]
MCRTVFVCSCAEQVQYSAQGASVMLIVPKMNELKGNSSLPAPERESERKKETEKRRTTIFFWVNQLPTPSPHPSFHASLPLRAV